MSQSPVSENDLSQPVAPCEVDLLPPVVYSMVTLSRLHGRQITPQVLMGGKVAQQSPPAACLRAARRAGFDGRILRRDDLRLISPLTLPCIPLLKNNRSCVLTALNGNEATVIFPEDGETPRRVPIEMLNAEHSGYVMFSAPQTTTDRRGALPLMQTRRWFWDVLLYYWPIYQHVVVASVIINVVGIASSLFAMNVYDRVVPNGALETLWVLAVGVTLAYFCDFILRNLRGYFVDEAGRNADVILSTKLVDKVLSMRFDKKPESTGALVNNLREFESLREFFSSSTLIAFTDLPFVALFLLLIGIIGGPLVILPLAAIPLMICGGWLLHLMSQRASGENFQQGMNKHALLVELVNGLETIKCSMAENRMRQRWEQAVGGAARSATRARRYATLTSTLSSSLTQMVSVGMIVWGVYLIGAGSLSMGGLIACNLLVGRAMAPLMQISAMIHRLEQSRLALASLNTIMALPTESSANATADFGDLPSSLTLQNVTFSYPASTRHSLEDVSLVLKPGERLGVIGRMGSGKSTLGKLLVGLYQPQEGSVRFGDVDIRQMDTADLRARMGFLPQDVVLFYGSIRDNIALGDPTVSDRLVLRAATLAGVTDFIRDNPAGLAAQVGERGANLSGGQRQAIALARALLHDPDVLILDEPSSNMDVMSENALRARLHHALAGRSLVLVTHRMSMLSLVDRLVVMDEGRIIADGPRDVILNRLAQGSVETAPPDSPPTPPVPTATTTTTSSELSSPAAATEVSA